MMNCLPQKPISILYVTPYNGPSGANFSLLRLLENLHPEKFRPLIVCPQPAGGMLIEKAEALGVPVIALYMEEWGDMGGKAGGLRRMLAWPKRMMLRASTILNLLRLIKRYPIPIVHTNSVLAIEGAVAAKLANVPHVWHIRDRIGPGGSVQFHFGTEKAVRLIDRLSHTVIAISDYVREPFDYHGAADKTVTIYNSVDLQDFLSVDKHTPKVREEFHISTDVSIIATVGHITPEKRHEDFIRAAIRIHSDFPDTRFMLVGKILEYHQDYYAHLKSLISSLGLDEAVIFTDLRQDIPNILSEIDILVHPRSNEGFGRVLIEAMAAGKPVVTVN